MKRVQTSNFEWKVVEHVTLQYVLLWRHN